MTTNDLAQDLRSRGAVVEDIHFSEVSEAWTVRLEAGGIEACGTSLELDQALGIALLLLDARTQIAVAAEAEATELGAYA